MGTYLQLTVTITSPQESAGSEIIASCVQLGYYMY